MSQKYISIDNQKSPIYWESKTKFLSQIDEKLWYTPEYPKQAKIITRSKIFVSTMRHAYKMISHFNM